MCVQIGVNNTFLLVNSMKCQDSSLPLEKRVGLALAEVGPSITLASLTEFVVFSMGVFSSAPACQVLSAFIGMASPCSFFSYVVDSSVQYHRIIADVKVRMKTLMYANVSKRVDVIGC